MSETVGFRLSPQQELQVGAEDPRAVVQCAAVLTGPVREAELRRALDQVVARHEILRTTFRQAPGVRGRTQVIEEALAPAWSTAELDQDLELALAREAERGLDIDRSPLVRATLLGAETEHPALLLTVHAACADAASLLLALDEIA